ncbi:MAG: PH domain-containing protein [Planctomycetota bacterium]
MIGIDDDRPHRLHPLSVPVCVGVQAAKLIGPFLLVVWLAKGSAWERWALLFVVLDTLYEALAYFTTRYRFTATEIVVRRGLIFRSERHIPFARVQNIDLVQNPIERRLKLAEVRLETASGEAPEAILRDLSLDAVAEMRRRVLGMPLDATAAGGEPPAGAGPRGAGAGGHEGRTLVRLRTRELVALGLAPRRGMAIVGVLTGAAWELDLLDRSAVTDRIESWWLSFGAPHALLLTALVAAAAIVAFLLVSVAWTIVHLHGFRLERRGEDLHLECGLVTRRTATIPRRRIQLVSVRATLLQRWLRCVSIRVETAGGIGDKEADTTSRRWFVPWLPAARVCEILAEVRPDFDVEPPAWMRTAPQTRRRMMRKAILVSLLLTLGAAAIVPPWGLAAGAVFLPLALWHATVAARILAYARTAGGVAFRSGAWTRAVSATRGENVQAVLLSESPFDRRWAMASLRVDTAGAGPAGHRIDIPYLERDVAARLYDDLAAEAGRSPLPGGKRPG